MKRLFWLGLGIAVGVIVVRQVVKAAETYSPSGVAGSARQSAAGLWDSVRDFVADVREGMAEREAEIAYAFEHGVSLDDVDDVDTLGRDVPGRDVLGQDALGQDALGRDTLGQDALGRDEFGPDDEDGPEVRRST